MPTRTAIADAAIRVVARCGLDSLSVRNVAREAAVAPGTVQHHYRSRIHLLLSALERVVERQLMRVVLTGEHTSGVDALRSGLRALLPVDDERRDEATVWIAFVAAAAANPELAPRHRELVVLLRERIRDVIALAHDQREIPVAVDPTVTAVLLAASFDGLLVHGITRSSSTADSLNTLLDQAIDRLLDIDQPAQAFDQEAIPQHPIVAGGRSPAVSTKGANSSAVTA